MSYNSQNSWENKKVVKFCLNCYLVQHMHYKYMSCPDCGQPSLAFFEDVERLKHNMRLYPDWANKYLFASSDLQAAYESIKTELVVTICNDCDLVENIPRNIDHCPECDSMNREKLNYISDFREFLKKNPERYYDFRITNPQLVKVYEQMRSDRRVR